MIRRVLLVFELLLAFGLLCALVVAFPLIVAGLAVSHVLERRKAVPHAYDARGHYGRIHARPDERA